MTMGEDEDVTFDDREGSVGGGGEKGRGDSQLKLIDTGRKRTSGDVDEFAGVGEELGVVGHSATVVLLGSASPEISQAVGT